MSELNKEKYLSRKFFNAFWWSTGISFFFLLIFVYFFLDYLNLSGDGSLVFKVVILCFLAAAIGSILTGVIAMLIPTNIKIIYIPTSIIIGGILSNIFASFMDSSFMPQRETPLNEEVMQSEYEPYPIHENDKLNIFEEEEYEDE